MKVVTTADLHGYLPDIPKCDVLIIAGDVCPQDNHVIKFQQSWLLNEFTEWLQFTPADHILGIGGNHDFALEASPRLARSLPWTYLLDEGHWINDVLFWGIPWVPNLKRWAFHQDAEGLHAKYSLVAHNTEVLIAHGPPRRILDKTCETFGGENVGSVAAAKAIESHFFSHFICGHIHEAFGVEQIGSTTVANVSFVDEVYAPRNRFFEFHK